MSENYTWYNQERKELFLKNDDISVAADKMFRTIFTASEDLESFFDLDVSDFSLTQLQSLFVLRRWYNVSTFSAYRTYFKIYIAWCIDQGYTSNVNNAAHLNQKDVGKEVIRQEMFKDEESFIQTIEQMYPVQHYDGVEYMLKAYLYLLWLGFSKGEALLVRKDQLDDDAVLGDNWSAYNVDSRILNALRYAAEMTMFDIPIANPVIKSGMTHRPLADTPYILRTTANARSTNGPLAWSCASAWLARVNREQREMQKANRTYVPKNLAYSKVFLCGRYVALYNWEQTKKHRADAFNYDEWASLARVDYDVRNDKRKAKKSYYPFLSSYKEWRTAFYGEA